MSGEAPSKQTRSILRCAWFCSVREISDIGLQRRTWLDLTNRNPHWSYIEFCSSYPADDQLQDGVHWCYLSAEEFETLRELHSALVGHEAPNGNDYDNAAILNDPAWHNVVALAERTRQRLLESVEEPIERQALLGDVTE
jgi:hypothetical protein